MRVVASHRSARLCCRADSRLTRRMARNIYNAFSLTRRKSPPNSYGSAAYRPTHSRDSERKAPPQKSNSEIYYWSRRDSSETLNLESSYGVKIKEV